MTVNELNGLGIRWILPDDILASSITRLSTEVDIEVRRRAIATLEAIQQVAPILDSLGWSRDETDTYAEFVIEGPSRNYIYDETETMSMLGMLRDSLVDLSPVVRFLGSIQPATDVSIVPAQPTTEADARVAETLAARFGAIADQAMAEERAETNAEPVIEAQDSESII